MEEREPQGESSTKPNLFSRMVAINVGLPIFKESLEAQGVEVIHVTWSRPAGGDEEVLSALEALLS